MGIEGKHAYRFGYMNSEEWRTVRIEALAKFDARCCICGRQDIHNDAHHVFYEKSFWETKAEDLVVLCRDCHTLVHELMGLNLSVKNKEQAFSEFRSFVLSLSKWSKEIWHRDTFWCLDRFAKRKQLDEIKHLSRVAHKAPKSRCFACRKSGNISVKTFEGTDAHSNRTQPWCESCWKAFEPLHLTRWPDIRSWLEKHREWLKSQKLNSP